MRRSRQVGNASIEHLALLALAVLGAVAMTNLGGATSDAIGRNVDGETRAYVASSPLSAQAGTASALGVSTKGLYRGVKGKLRPPYEFQPFARLLENWVGDARRGEPVALQQITRLVGRDARPTAVLLHGLLNEYARLVTSGELVGMAQERAGRALVGLDGSNWDWTGNSPLTGQTGIPISTHWADDAVRYGAPPAAGPFLERIRAADKIFRGGITPEELQKVFPNYPAKAAASDSSVRAAPATDELAEFLGAFDGPTSPVTVFEWQYLANPERALSALPDEARGYLEAEVLPILRATYAKKDESLRYLTDEGEARVMARLVRGDVDGAKKALTRAKRTGAPALPADMAEAVTFASRLFSGGDAPFGKLRAFSEEEASTLVRFSDDVLADLRSRTDGGALVADLADVLRGRDWTRAAGRTDAHQTKALESLLQAVARGSEADFKTAQGFVTQIVSDFSQDLTDELKQLLEHFRGETPTEATRAD